MSSNDVLIIAYKNMRDLIKKTPNDKNKIINEYTDLILKINKNNYYDNSNPDIELQNMLKKNPLEFFIYNNFQKNNPNINFTQFRNTDENNQHIIDTSTYYENK